MISPHWSENLSMSLKKLYPEYPTTPMKIAEIGCFEGFGTLKLVERCCKHEESRVVCIDPWDDVYVKEGELFKNYNDDWWVNQYNRFLANTTSIQSKLILKRGTSTNVLPTLEPKSFDLIYVDGDHSSNQVYLDAQLSLPLMKQGGIILFDDYIWGHGGDPGPSAGIQKFLEEHKTDVEVVYIEYNQCAIKVLV